MSATVNADWRCSQHGDRLVDGSCPTCRSLALTPDPRQARIKDLEEWRPILIQYLEQKFKAEDWHGVQDAASDLRDLDCELDGLKF
jgi:hypothetical protein